MPHWRDMLIREATAEDWRQIWPFLRHIVTAGETYAYDPDMDEATAPWAVVGRAADTQRGLGAGGRHGARHGEHVPQPLGPRIARCQCELYGRSPRLGPRRRTRARGRGARLGRANGFRAMQFNAVVETNLHAVALWRSLGFEIIGTVPEAFRHPTDGYVGLHIMYRRL
jgi:hypothetical protein